MQIFLDLGVTRKKLGAIYSTGVSDGHGPSHSEVLIDPNGSIMSFLERNFLPYDCTQLESYDVGIERLTKDDLGVRPGQPIDKR